MRQPPSTPKSPTSTPPPAAESPRLWRGSVLSTPNRSLTVSHGTRMTEPTSSAPPRQPFELTNPRTQGSRDRFLVSVTQGSRGTGSLRSAPQWRHKIRYPRVLLVLGTWRREGNRRPIHATDVFAPMSQHRHRSRRSTKYKVRRWAKPSDLNVVVEVELVGVGAETDRVYLVLPFV